MSEAAEQHTLRTKWIDSPNLADAKKRYELIFIREAQRKIHVFNHHDIMIECIMLTKEYGLKGPWSVEIPVDHFDGHDADGCPILVNTTWERRPEKFKSDVELFNYIVEHSNGIQPDRFSMRGHWDDCPPEREIPEYTYKPKTKTQLTFPLSVDEANEIEQAEKERENPVEKKYIDCTPSWEGLLPVLVEVAANGTSSEARTTAYEELRKLLRFADGKK